ncbi:MAG: IS630 family transposase [Nitrospira sp.]|nr:IS630 family transposase [Nitrospira sp.]
MEPFSTESLNYQIRHLSEAERLSARQIAKHLNVSKKNVENVLKGKTLSPLLFRMRVAYLGQVCQKNTAPISGWYRDIELGGYTTLNELNDVIQQVLGWDNAHLYVFVVNNKRYAYLGDDDYVIEDIFENHCSAKIFLNALGLREADTFIYNYDFGDDHLFLLTVLGIEKGDNKKDSPKVIGLAGRDLIQYKPDTDYAEDEGQIFVPEYAEKIDPKKISLLPKTRSVWSEDIWKVDFIVAKDKKTIEQWRTSKDKRKWEIAVTILENRSMPKVEIAKKIERPVKQIREWIRIFNFFGIEGLKRSLPNGFRDESQRHEKINLRTNNLIEIIHHKPSYYGVNRSSWTLPALAEIYKKQFGEELSTSTISVYLKAAKYTIKKARRVLTSPDPDYREKVDGLLKTLHSLGPGEMLFFIDELGPLKVKKYGGRTYAKAGDVAMYPQKQAEHGSISMAGALSATTNQVTWMYIKAKDSSSMIDLIEILFNQYHSMKKLYVTWDCASWHSSNALVSWLEVFNAETEKLGEGPVIEFIPLPTSSQFLDVIESVFSGMKRAIIHNSDYGAEAEMKSAISRHFRERNDFFRENPKRAGKKIWEIDFFSDINAIKSGNYREW